MKFEPRNNKPLDLFFMSQVVIENVCDAVGQWSFTAPPNPPPLPPGNYSIQFGNAYMTVDANHQIVMSATNNPWFFTTSVDKNQQVYYYLNYIADGWETPAGTLLSALPDSTQTQLVYATDQTQASSLPIQLGTDQTIFDNDGKNYFVPNSQGSAVVITDINDPNKTKWTFTPLKCPPATSLPSGEYSLSFASSAGVPQYLSYTTTDKTFGSVIISTPTFSLANNAWKYDAEKKTLSTGCNTTPLYLMFDPFNPMWAVLTTDASKAATSVVLTSTAILIGDYEALVPAASGPYIMSYSCLSNAAVQWKNVLLTSPVPTGGPASGYYTLKHGDQCLSVSGGNVVLDACPTAPAVWKYDAANFQLSFQNQCLVNPSASCSSFGNLTMGSCQDPNSKRFVLGPNSLYDPVLQLCYGTPGGTRSSAPYRDCVCTGTRMFRSRQSHTFHVWSVVWIVLAVVLLGAVWWWTRRSSSSRVLSSGSR